MYEVVTEAAHHIAAREALLDDVMGPGRFRKSSERIREGRIPAEGLALACLAHVGGEMPELVGTVRLWHVGAGTAGEALLLGPLAVGLSHQGAGIGSMLMRAALERAAARGHRAVLLVGDPDYYARFGFSVALAGGLAMPGPFERHRFQGVELVKGALDGALGVVVPTGAFLEDGVARAA